MVLGQLVLLLGVVLLGNVLAEGGVDIIDSAAPAEGLPLAQEDLLDAGIVDDLQLAGPILGQLRVQSLVEGGRADVPIGFYSGEESTLVAGGDAGGVAVALLPPGEEGEVEYLVGGVGAGVSRDEGSDGTTVEVLLVATREVLFESAEIDLHFIYKIIGWAILRGRIVKDIGQIWRKMVVILDGKMLENLDS